LGRVQAVALKCHGSMCEKTAGPRTLGHRGAEASTDLHPLAVGLARGQGQLPVPTRPRRPGNPESAAPGDHQIGALGRTFLGTRSSVLFNEDTGRVL